MSEAAVSGFGFFFAIYLPSLLQIIMGGVLAAVGILVLVLGHRRYVRRNQP